MIKFAFYGRVSTEDQQDPEASYNWQRSRADALVAGYGEITASYFDIGLSRSLPWKRREKAADLLVALVDSARRFGAVVIGEPQRAFYGNQYGLTMPLFTHYGVGLWVPEVGGPIDPDSEAHDLIMSVFGGMSKGERNRIKIRVRSAMSSQAKIEGRFLGGRPPYGYLLADAGPHPNPGKAADCKRLHRLEPDPIAAPVVQRIYAEYLGGTGFRAIAEHLTRDGILCPSAHDRARNPHRTGVGWPTSVIRVILTNPRYTGRQVWNKQRKTEVLLDLENVAEGYETKQKWNKPGDWIFSDQLAHEPLVSVEIFEAVQARIASRAAMATASAQDDDETIAEEVDAQQLADCERKLTQYRALLEQGTDPVIVAEWIREVELERARLQATARTEATDPVMTEDELTAIVSALGDIVKVLADAEPKDKTLLYKALGLRLEYDINANAVNAAVMATDGTHWDPSVDERLRNYGVRGGT
jgi:DNA invertase Pin-like site-specific DNA recombinase